MTVFCEITEEKYDNGTREIPLYGLRFWRCGEEELCRVEGITPNRAELEVLRARINASELDEIHIRDVLEDALVEWEALPL